MKYTIILTLFPVLFNIHFALPLEEKNDEYVKDDTEEIADYFEGDMNLNKEQIKALLSPTKRNGLILETYRWKQNTVYYDLGSDFNRRQKRQIKRALREISDRTCLKFKPRKKNTSDYVYLTGKNKGCYSAVGRQGGRQSLNLQPNTPGKGCFRLGTIIHEFMHTLGFYHQQTTSDRDKYVSIIWENIKEGKDKNFKRRPKTVVTSFGVEYDYGSIMHYGKFAFSKNGKATIVPHDKTAEIGQRNGLSAGDLTKINAMYNC